MIEKLDFTKNIFDITEEFPETIAVFVSNGFPQMQDREKRETLGKNLSLELALTLKQFDKNEFEILLLEQINNSNTEGGLSSGINKKNIETIQITGLLPCPVKMPLGEGLKLFSEKYFNTNNKTIKADLKAASMGLDWLKDILLKNESDDELADIFISAGFDLFFDKELMGKHKERGVFRDFTPFDRLNSDFDNDEICLRDPLQQYSMLAVVPAVFLVNPNELKGRAIPQSWSDLLKPEYKNSVSLPISDFDLFNAILLNLNKMYGKKAITSLGQSLLESMHPAQMVKSEKKFNIQRPAITIMPYFFTKTILQTSSMTAVWPSDGAIISPIFLLSKRKKEKDLRSIVEFFLSEKIGKILSHQGKFPSINPNIDNLIPNENKYMWLGWDYIQNNNIAQLIKDCEETFNNAVNI